MNASSLWQEMTIRVPKQELNPTLLYNRGSHLNRKVELRERQPREGGLERKYFLLNSIVSEGGECGPY